MAHQFAAEAGLTVSEDLLDQFAEMYRVLEKMRAGDLNDAVEWARNRRDELERIGSGLEFELRKIQFVGLLGEGRESDALEYARTWFGDFIEGHMKGIFAPTTGH